MFCLELFDLTLTIIILCHFLPKQLLIIRFVVEMISVVVHLNLLFVFLV